MKKIGLHGSYYCRNFGDTLITYIIKDWITEHSPEVSINLPFVNSEKEAFEILKCANNLTPISDLDGLVFGPGGYFGEQPGSFIKRFLWSIRNYKRHIVWNNQLYKNDIAYMIIGVGVGPLSFNFLKKRVIKLFKGAKFISVRDKYSKQYLMDWGVSGDKINISPDVALTLPKNDGNLDNEKPKVALHFPHINLDQPDKLNHFVQFIKKIHNKNEIYLLEDGEGQYETNSIKNVLKKEGIDLAVIKYVNPEELINELRSVDKIITSKLHVGIVGYALGKRTLSIPSHTKTIRFYEQIKRKEFCIHLNDVSTELLCTQFEKLDTIQGYDNILYDEAFENKKVLFKFLDSI
jgi:polysaccharide pyruvyl transferase WcaK-like protein